MQPDEEHQAFALAIEDRSGGYPRHHRVDLDFVTTGEFRTLASSYQDVKDIRGPMIVKTTGAMAADEAASETGESAAAANDTAIGGAPLDEATRLAAEPKPLDASSGPKQPHKAGREADVRIESLDDLVEFFIAAGKKGVAVNRYKGLGEMNPGHLWETTMDPEGDRCAGARRRSYGSGPDVHDADGRPGRAAPQVHRGQRARREEPRYLVLDPGASPPNPIAVARGGPGAPRAPAASRIAI